MAVAIYNEGTWTIPAGEALNLNINAEFLHVLSCSAATFGVSFDDEAGGKARPGANFRAKKGEQYSVIRIENESATDALIVSLGYGKGDFELNQFKSIPAGTLKSSADAAITGATTALVLAANPNRREAVVANPFGNPREFRVGDASVGVAQGIEVPPGEKIFLRSTAAIYAYNPDVASMNISVLEVTE